MKKIITFIYLIFLLSMGSHQSNAAEKTDLLKIDWSFKGLFGKFDRGSLQRGYQVYSEVCAGCHSMKYLSYRNLSEKGGPEFSVEQAKAIAASFETRVFRHRQHDSGDPRIRGESVNKRQLNFNPVSPAICVRVQFHA